jgi:hypothetical protein
MTSVEAPMPGMVTDAAEVARFAAERDEDARRERWLLAGQTAMLLIVAMVVAVLMVVHRS